MTTMYQKTNQIIENFRYRLVYLSTSSLDTQLHSLKPKLELTSIIFELTDPSCAIQNAKHNLLHS